MRFPFVRAAMLAGALLLAALPAVAEKAHAYSEANPPRAGDEGVFHGPLIRVIDGDSFRARIQGVDMEFRLYAVDAPESDQPYGRQSKQELAALLGQSSLVMVFVDVDRYGRIVADVWTGRVHVNRALVSRGAAYFYPEFAKDDSLYEVEQDARDGKRGLWQLPLAQREKPWEWRERKRGKRNPRPATKPAS